MCLLVIQFLSLSYLGKYFYTKIMLVKSLTQSCVITLQQTVKMCYY